MKTFYICLSSIFFTLSLFAQSNLDKGNEYFDKRFENIEGLKADPYNINKAIAFYEKAENSTEKYIALLRSYEFKGSWTDISDDEARETYHKGIELGEKVKDDHPENPGIWYWYIANLSRWGDQVPITKAAKEGILDDVRNVTKKIIDIDPKYEEAGALRLLGGLHLKAPNIPFVLTWPSEEVAQKLLNQAYDIAPQNAANTYYFALMLINEDKRTEAKELLEEFVTRDPRPEYLLADIKFINKGKELYNDEFQ